MWQIKVKMEFHFFILFSKYVGRTILGVGDFEIFLTVLVFFLFVQGWTGLLQDLA
jgi:hypothetical protein